MNVVPTISILGGGMAGVTAAYFLSGNPEIAKKYTIELYQQGWRLGGKGASGRTVGDHRIEEHGLHVWFGYYENAFRLLRDCHDELETLAERGVKRWSTALTSIEHGFRPISSIGIVEDELPGWRPWIATFPEDDLSPWDRDMQSEPPDWDVRWCMRTILTRSVAMVAALVRSAADEALMAPTSIESVDAPGGLEELLVGLGQRAAQEAELADGPADILAILVSRMVEVMADGATGDLFDVAQEVMASAGRLLDAIRLRLDERLVVDRAAVRRLWSLADVLLAIVRGLVQHRVSSVADFDLLDEFEFRAWLIGHGALAASATSSLIRTVAYDLPFAYERGDPDLSTCGAGTALRTLFRAFFTYRGAIMWKMNAGMGDVVFAPLYELLHKRGVQFKFFHQVTDIDTDGSRITGFRVREQGRDPYLDGCAEDRLVTVTVKPDGAMPEGQLRCWPSKPEGSDQPRAERLEAWWNPVDGEQSDVPVGEEDWVLFALPLGTIPYVADKLCRNRQRWRDLVENVKTTATQAMQVWSRRSATELGWFPDAVVGGYDAPYDTFSDMSELTFQEETDAATVLYLCAVLPDPQDDDEGPERGGESSPKDQAAWVQRRVDDVRERAADFFDRHAIGLWPGAMDPATGRFDQNLEAVPRYVRGNFQPSDRYVLSVPGSAKYRLEPGNSGYGRLVVAGDWTRCVINAGCVEAATISGMLAAEAILLANKQKLPVPIIGRPNNKEAADS